MKTFLILALIAELFVSCKGREKEPPLPMATKDCQNSIKGEYHSYFDSVEKCIEKEADSKKEKK